MVTELTVYPQEGKYYFILDNTNSALEKGKVYRLIKKGVTTPSYYFDRLGNHKYCYDTALYAYDFRKATEEEIISLCPYAEQYLLSNKQASLPDCCKNEINYITNF